MPHFAPESSYETRANRDRCRSPLAAHRDQWPESAWRQGGRLYSIKRNEGSHSGRESRAALIQTRSRLTSGPEPKMSGRGVRGPRGKSFAGSEKLTSIPTQEGTGTDLWSCPCMHDNGWTKCADIEKQEKFRLFVSGTLDPFPFEVYTIQAGIEQAKGSRSGYGQGAAGYARRFGACVGRWNLGAISFRPMRFHRLFTGSPIFP